MFSIYIDIIPKLSHYAPRSLHYIDRENKDIQKYGTRIPCTENKEQKTKQKQGMKYGKWYISALYTEKGKNYSSTAHHTNCMLAAAPILQEDNTPIPHAP